MKIYAHCLTLLFLWQCEAKVHQTLHSHSHSHINTLKLRHDGEESNSTDPVIEEVDSHPKIHPINGGALSNKTTKSGSHEDHGACTFPNDAGLVAITPKSKNAGWAMSPDQSCSPGSYCPYACPSGQVMAQWNPNAKSYTYPQSMDGGLYCDRDGQVKKPFPEKPYCVPGTGGVAASNKVGKGVSFCQTVLPGNEAMLIPTHVVDSADLAVPGNSYWCNTAAHYYINPPGVGVEEACTWGDASKPVGNWSPYVAGANTDNNGETFVKIGWNPIYTGSSLSSTPPNFGVKIVCESGNCVGTPCSIDPASNGVGGVLSANQASGAGGANFCVVTVPKGSKANIEVFSTNGTKSTPDPSLSNKPKGKSENHPSNDPNDEPKETPNETVNPSEHPVPSGVDENLDKSLSNETDQKPEQTPSSGHPVEPKESPKLPEESPKSPEDNLEYSSTSYPEQKDANSAQFSTSVHPDHPDHSVHPDHLAHPSPEPSSSSDAEETRGETPLESSSPVTETSSLSVQSEESAHRASATSNPEPADSSVISDNVGSPNKKVHHHQTTKDNPSDATNENGSVDGSQAQTENYVAHPNMQTNESEGSVTWKSPHSCSIFGFVILFIAAHYIL